jgi:hypothetical protein
LDTDHIHDAGEIVGQEVQRHLAGGGFQSRNAQILNGSTVTTVVRFAKISWTRLVMAQHRQGVSRRGRQGKSQHP